MKTIICTPPDCNEQNDFQEDNPIKLTSIVLKPLSQLPFPLERIQKPTVLMDGDGNLAK